MRGMYDGGREICKKISQSLKMRCDLSSGGTLSRD